MKSSVLVYLGSILLIAIGFAMVPWEMNKKEITIEKSNVIYEDQTVCYSTGFDGWKRVAKRERLAIAELVANGKATVIEAQTLECTDYSKQPLKVFLLKEQWYRRGKVW
ncbi:MAG: hypothetical protein PHE50_00060 [Dehalococcoidales bacterium]|nr:hypothetical protein [Dehalococcoidales bacterium]